MRTIGYQLGRAVWAALAQQPGDPAELETREARMAAIVVKHAVKAGMLVLVETSPEVIVIALAVGLVWKICSRNR